MESANDNRSEYTILIVDDHPLVTFGLSELLGKLEGLEVCGTAGSAEEAIALYADLRPDLLILDIMLPDADGFTVMDAICEKNPAAKILVLSSLDPDILESKVRRHGGVGFVSKGTLLDDIVPAVRKALSTRRI
jgi:DNA-binding NarL/FixJ family response regulator